MKLAVKAPLALALVTVTLGAAFALWLHVTMVAVTDGAARDAALAQLQVSSRALTATGTVPDVATLDDPAVPQPLRGAVAAGARATYLARDPDVAWAAEPTADGRVLAVRTSWAEARDLLDELDRRLVAGVVGLVVLSAALALAAAYTLSRRLGLAERTARRIAEGDLTARVSDGVRGRDEVAALARTIDALAASMQERLASEQRVTADIAHDLRTPVTGLVTAAALLPEGRASELVQSQVQRLWRLVEDLLEVARLDEARQSLELDEVTTSALARRGVTAAAAAGVRDVTIEVTQDAMVATDPRRVERVLVNLLANAARHGRPPLVCRVAGPTITVADAGAGFPAELLAGLGADGPRRWRTGAADRGSGHGLGLTIAAGQARAVGARLEFGTAAEGGAAVSLHLPASAPAADGRAG